MPTEKSWLEKWRPTSFDDLKGFELFKKVANKNIEDRAFNHMLLFGPPGTGKTSAVSCFLKHIYPKSSVRNARTKIFNASDDCGLALITKKIEPYLHTNIISLGKSKSITTLRFIVLDEADNMTEEAMGALRSLMEKHADIVRFILIVNDISKIMDAIKSRCTLFHAPFLSRETIFCSLQTIAQKEGLTHISEDDIQLIVDSTQSNLRHSIHALYMARNADTTVASALSMLGKVPHSSKIKLLNEFATKKNLALALSFGKTILEIMSLEEWVIFVSDHYYQKAVHSTSTECLFMFRNNAGKLASILDALSSGANPELQIPLFYLICSKFHSVCSDAL